MVRRITEPRTHGQRTGSIWIRDYDLGVFTTLGGSPDADPLIDEILIDVPGLPVKESRCSLVMKNPEPAVSAYRLPRIVISRDSFEPQKERRHPVTEEYRVVAQNANPITVSDPAGGSGATLTGHDSYETREQADPYDISYTIECWHRYDNWAQLVLFVVMKTFRQIKGELLVKDSLDQIRGYNIFMESGPAPLTEINSFGDRVVGYAVSYRVTAEIDFESPLILPSFRYPQPALTPIRGRM